jgi:hypothetical protein
VKIRAFLLSAASIPALVLHAAMAEQAGSSAQGRRRNRYGS